MQYRKRGSQCSVRVEQRWGLTVWGWLVKKAFIQEHVRGGGSVQSDGEKSGMIVTLRWVHTEMPPPNPKVSLCSKQQAGEKSVMVQALLVLWGRTLGLRGWWHQCHRFFWFLLHIGLSYLLLHCSFWHMLCLCMYEGTDLPHWPAVTWKPLISWLSAAVPPGCGFSSDSDAGCLLSSLISLSFQLLLKYPRLLSTITWLVHPTDPPYPSRPSDLSHGFLDYFSIHLIPNSIYPRSQMTHII